MTLGRKQCICTIIEADHPRNEMDPACPIHGGYLSSRPTPREMYGDEIADHAVAAAYGGINRDMKYLAAKGKLYQPNPGDKHAAIPNYDDYCMQRMSNGQPCGANSLDPVHTSEFSFEPEPWPAGKLRVRAIKEDNTVRIEVDNPPTLEGERILREVLPELLERFLSKNVDYQDFPEADLGPRAHFIGIWRKVCKLKQGLWFGKPLEHEQVSEVIDDTVGHLLLAKLGLLG